MQNEPTADELNSLWTAAIECEGIGGSSMETLHALYEARMKKFSWIGTYEIGLMFSLDNYLEYRGYKKTITTPIENESCHCSDGPFHYKSCPKYDANKVNPFEELGKRMSELGDKK